MEFDVRPVRREGKLIPRWQVGSLRVRGILSVQEERDAVCNRIVRVARLQDAKGADLLLPLKDVELVYLRHDHWTMTGYEHAPLDYTEGSVGYQQSWVLAPAEYRDREQANQAASDAAAASNPPQPWVGKQRSRPRHWRP